MSVNRRVNLLLVDDDSLQTRVLSNILRNGLPARIEVLAMTDPHKALEHIKSNRVDVLVTDLDMPSIGGLALLRSAKQWNAAVQALVLSASSTSEDLGAALNLGAADFLLKPVDPAVLVELVLQADQRLHRWVAALAGTIELDRQRSSPALAGKPAP